MRIEQLAESLIYNYNSWSDVQKDNFLTQVWVEPKIFYPKKVQKFDKSNSWQNSVKGPKDTISAKECQKVT